MNRRHAPLALTVVALLAGACTPSNDINIGLKDYATDVVYGDPTPSTTQLPPDPVPVASLSPGFPAFIVPAPPTPDPDTGAFVLPPPLPPVIEFIPDPCPIATAGSNRIAVGPKIIGQPGVGTYKYNQQGSFKVGAAAPVLLPPQGARTVKNVKVVGGNATWDVEIVEFGIKTVTSYREYRPSGRPELDGLYITRVVQTAPKRTSEEFTPIDPGLRIFPEPASSGTSFRSTANDPTRGTSVVLEGTVKDVRTFDICGVFVEGWAVSTTLNVRKPLDPAQGADDFTTTAEYVLSTSLGGLIIADSVQQKGNENGVVIDRSTISTLADLAAG